MKQTDKPIYNYNGFNVEPITLENFLKECEDKEVLEVVKVDGAVLLHRPQTNQLYWVTDPSPEKEKL